MSKSIIKGASLLTFSQIIVAVCSFARNIIVARLISVEDYGIASLFAVVISVAEIVSYIGIDRFLVQAEDGGSESVQATAQFFNAARGVISAIIILSFSPLFSRLFNLPDLAWAFGALAIVPFTRGFAHLDLIRLQRNLDFSAVVWVDTIPQIAVLVLVIPIALWLGDYRVMLWIVILQAIAYLLVSHLVARRPYRLEADISVLRAMFAFGWPLLVNTILMFGIHQGDSIIVGIMLSKEELAYLSAVLLLLMTPSSLLTRVFGTTALPVLSRANADPEMFAGRSSMTVQLSFVLSISFGVFLAIAGPSVFIALFGQKYKPATFIFSWIALMFAIRIISTGLITIAIALAKTKIAMYANIGRATGLAIAFGAVYLGYGLLGVVVSGFVGELLGLTMTIFLLARKHSMSFRPYVLNFLILVFFFGLTMYVASSFAKGNYVLLEVSLSILVLVPGIFAMMYASPDVCSVIMQRANQFVRSVTRSRN